MRSAWRAVVLFCLAVLPACAATPFDTPPPEPPRVELAGTIVHELPSTATGRRYQLWVDLPGSYATSVRSYPVVFVTDAGLWFPVVRGLGRLQGQRGQNIEDFILVGLANDQDLSPPASRARDYTPTNPLLQADVDRSTYQSDLYGEAEIYRDYIETEVFPFIAAHYRADMRRNVYLGHSYGGLFGAYVLLTRPEMFQTYLLGSPSFWFDDKVMFDLEESYAAAHEDLSARVMIVAGGYETIRRELRYYRTVDIVEDLKALAERLEARGYPNLEVEANIIEGEDHFTVFPDLVTRGLMWALPGRGPYIGG